MGVRCITERLAPATFATPVPRFSQETAREGAGVSGAAKGSGPACPVRKGLAPVQVVSPLRAESRASRARFRPSASARVSVGGVPAPDELRAPVPNRHRRSLPRVSGRLTRAPTSGSPPEHTARPKRGWEAGHPLKRVESGANCEDQRREANPQEPLVSRDFAPLSRWDVTTENRGVPGSSPGLAIAKSRMDARFAGFR